MPFSASEFSSTTVVKKCSEVISKIRKELEALCKKSSVDEYIIVEEIFGKVRMIEENFEKLGKKDILFLGRTGVGKSFLLNLLFQMTCIDPSKYSSKTFQSTRRRIGQSLKVEVAGTQEEDNEAPIVHIMNLDQEEVSLSSVPVELEALQGTVGRVKVVPINPLTKWKIKDPAFAEKFANNPSTDYDYRLCRYKGNFFNSYIHQYKKKCYFA